MGTDLDLGYCVELLVAHLSKFLGSLKQGWVNGSSEATALVPHLLSQAS